MSLVITIGSLRRQFDPSEAEIADVIRDTYRPNELPIYRPQLTPAVSVEEDNEQTVFERRYSGMVGENITFDPKRPPLVEISVSFDFEIVGDQSIMIGRTTLGEINDPWNGRLLAYGLALVQQATSQAGGEAGSYLAAVRVAVGAP